MFYKKGRTYGKRKFSRKGKRSAFRKKGRKTVTKSMLYRALGNSSETKIATTTAALTEFNSGIGSTGDSVSFLPGVLVGTGGGARIGHKIQPVSLNIQGYVAFNSYGVDADIYKKDAHLLGIRLFIYENKTDKSYQNNIADYNLLTNGADSSSFTGMPIQFNAPVNWDMFKFYADKKHIMRKGFGWTDMYAVASAQVTPTYTMSHIDSSLYWPFNITLTAKDLPAKFVYDTSESTSFPINFAPKISLGYAHLLGFQGPDIGIPLIRMQWVATLKYKDA